MMTGEERRKEILEQIRTAQKAVSGSALACRFGVSRQVIVQDVALLRAAGSDIISTSRGYLLRRPRALRRCFKMQHTDEQLAEELCAIVDLGGCVVDVFIHHRVYGTITAELWINSRHKVETFLEDIRSGKSSPLKNITSNYHYHTIEADSEEILDRIEDRLREKGFLVEVLQSRTG